VVAPKIDLTSAILLTLLALIWGGSFFLAAVVLKEVPPITVALFRVVGALPALALFVWFKGVSLPRNLKIWSAYLVMGALNNAIPFSLIFWSQTQITSGLTSILNGATGVTGVIVAGLLLHDERLTAHKLIGVVIGFFGVALTIGLDAMRSFDIQSLAPLAVLLAGLSYSLAGVWAKLRLSGQAPEMNALGMIMGSSLLLIPTALWLDGPPSLELMASTWTALLVLAVLCTSVPYLLYFNILKRAGSGNLMLVTLLIPPIAIGLGVIFLKESLQGTALMGFALIALGLTIIDGRFWVLFRPKR
jgi:drug/metabolite transporter (DMT)-like permease|tara:strand:+ start:2266 stop:3174 length:909 start_codon:yes stop_codon:yes gene_type:complete